MDPDLTLIPVLIISQIEHSLEHFQDELGCQCKRLNKIVPPGANTQLVFQWSPFKDAAAAAAAVCWHTYIWWLCLD